MATEIRGRKGAKGPKEKEKANWSKNGVTDGSGDAKKSDNETTPKVSKQPMKKSSKSGAQTQAPGKSWIMSCCSKVKYLFLAVFIPPFLNYASLQREVVELKPEGELYDVGWGRKMFLSCQGKGPPTVILDAPTGMNSDVWALVVKKLQENSNVCIYDRAGLGFSERPLNQSSKAQDSDSHINVNSDHQGSPFTVESMAEDLHRLISSSSQQPRPLILIGAELGSLIAQFYTHLYDSDVLGLVLVNPLPEDLFSEASGAWIQHWAQTQKYKKRLPPDLPGMPHIYVTQWGRTRFGALGPTYQSLQLGAALGITRLGLLVGALQQPITGENVPEDVILRQKYLLCHPRHLSSVVDEHHFINETFSQMRTLRKLRSLPSNISISVLSGNYYDEQMPSHLNKAWAIGEQKLLSKLPPTTQHVVVNGADRHMMYRKPEPIVEAVMRIVRKWRRSSVGGSKKA